MAIFSGIHSQVSVVKNYVCAAGDTGGNNSEKAWLVIGGMLPRVYCSF